MNVIFASYGNDSIALIQWAYEQGLKDVTTCYSNTGWAAGYWAGRVGVAEAWVKSLGFTPTQISSEGMQNLVRRKKAWPRGGGGKFQFCTDNLKQQPAIRWLDDVDPNKESTCLVGIRREESANRAQFPEFTEQSEKHGGRELWAPLVRYTESMRNALIGRTPFDVLPHRSKECWPCVNATKRELKLMDESTLIRVRNLEDEMGTNSKGNERVMFSPKRHGGAVGIDAVVQDALHNMDDMFTQSCDGGWCGS